MSLRAGGAEGDWPCVLAIEPIVWATEAVRDFGGGEELKMLSSFNGAARQGKPRSSCGLATGGGVGVKNCVTRELTPLMVPRQTSRICDQVEPPFLSISSNIDFLRP